MVKIKYLNKIIFVLLFSLILLPQIVVALEHTYPSTVIISAQVITPTVPPIGGEGGNNNPVNMPTTVNFSGMAYPSSKITILNNGSVGTTTIADASARFYASITDLDTGTYTFSVFGEDVNKVKSLSFSFPVFVKSGTTINISGIFLSPTINLDKSEVRKGDSLLVFGQTAPNKDLNILFHSNQGISKTVKSDATGLYSYKMDTTPLEYGDHKVKSETIIDKDMRATSAEVPFIVGSVSKVKDSNNSCGSLRGDLNCDNHVNLTDFSIMAFWYKKANPPAKVDLNSDGSITLVDFSIMVFNWTG